MKLDLVVRSAGEYDGAEVTARSAIECRDESLTLQSQKDDSDINVIVKRFGITGVMPQNLRPPSYIDYDEVFDFRTAMDTIRDAEKSFMAMPAEVRARFSNDPQEFLVFCSNPDNLEEMRKLGLAVPAPEAPPAEPAS